MIVTIATDGKLFLKFISYVHYYVYRFVSLFLLLIFPWHLYVNYPLTVTTVKREAAGGGLFKSHCLGIPQPNAMPRRKGGSGMIFIVYSHEGVYSRQGFIPNILRTTAYKIRTHLDEHQTFSS